MKKIIQFIKIAVLMFKNRDKKSGLFLPYATPSKSGKTSALISELIKRDLMILKKELQ